MSGVQSSGQPITTNPAAAPPPTRPTLQISKKEWEKGLAAVDVSKDDLNRLVLDYLIIEGYRDAAISFATECNYLPSTSSTSPIHPGTAAFLPASAGSDGAGGPGANNPFARVDYESIHERMLIREAVEGGRMEEAVRRVNELDSEILDTNPSLLFHLHLQRLIELIRHSETDQALIFASTELAPRGARNPEFLKELEKTMALLAFPELGGIDGSSGLENTRSGVGGGGASGSGSGMGEGKDQPAWASLGSLLKKEHRTKVAKELNAAILESQGQGQETKLSGLVRLMCWGEERLRGKGVVVPGIQVGGLLSPSGGEGVRKSEGEDVKMEGEGGDAMIIA